MALILCALPLVTRLANGGQLPSLLSRRAKMAFPVTNALVVSKCGSCHATDAKSNMSRISWIRTTPEGWEEAIKAHGPIAQRRA